MWCKYCCDCIKEGTDYISADGYDFCNLKCLGKYLFKHATVDDLNAFVEKYYVDEFCDFIVQEYDYKEEHYNSYEDREKERADYLSEY